ncbi:MAG TPA: XdhC family protein [Acidobacteriota bacterium]
MRDILSELESWRERGQSIALATVVETWGSGPRQLGAKMALAASGERCGALSGGCVEDSIASGLRAALQSGRPALLDLKVEDPVAWDAGLPCGGGLRVWIERLEPSWFEPLRRALAADAMIASVTVLRGPPELAGRKLIVAEDGSCSGTLGRFDPAAVETARQSMSAGRGRHCEWPAATPADQPVEVLVEVFGPAPTLIAIGGVSIAQPLCALAKRLGFRTVLVDPTATSAGSDAADLILPAWPAADVPAAARLTSNTAVAVLSQKPELDEPALRQALPSRAFYVGALGGRASQTRRRQRLLEAGLTTAQIERLKAPIGLDLGGRAPEEVALGIFAQIVAAKNDRSGILM